MKKIFKLSLFALFVGMISCEDATDIVQESELDETTAFQNVADLESGLLGVMSAYGPDAASNGDGDSILFNDLFTDNFKRGAASSGQGNQEYNFILQPNTSFAISIWGNRYATINFANRVMRAWDRIFPTLTNEDDIMKANFIKGQLLGMRALCHLDLAQYFTPNYLDPSSPSIIIMDFVPEITQTFPRNTAGEVFEFINGDLTEAAALLAGMEPEAGSFSDLVDEANGAVLYDGFSSSPGDYQYFINADVVKAIHARAALTQGNYALAQTLATELVADYPLSSGTEYENIFFTDDPSIDDEVIFSLSRVNGDANATALYYANTPVGPDASPFYEGANGLFNLYDDDDIRKDVNFLSGSTAGGQILIGKYRGSDDGPGINDIKIFRSSEMQFIIAECKARAGDLTGAANEIEELRDQRNDPTVTPGSYGSLPLALLDILLERRKEFAFEGHRYLDLKRLGTELGVGISRNELDCSSFSAPCDLPAGDYRFTLPIPRTELSPNPTIVQNPGYSS